MFGQQPVFGGGHVFPYLFFPSTPIELKLGLQVGGRLLPLATYLHQSL
jgi:hypothetical protein